MTPLNSRCSRALPNKGTDAAEAFRAAGREEQAVKEESERKLIEAYLPAFATDEDLNQAIEAAIVETSATSAKQMGAVIKAAQLGLAGKNR